MTAWVKANRPFVLAALAAAVASLAFFAIVELRWPAPVVAVAVDDFGEAAAAFLAAAMCGYAAFRSPLGRTRAGWAFLTAACMSWGLGEAVWSLFEVVMGISPFPSVADVGFLGFTPLAVIAVVLFAGRAGGTATAWRLWLDGLIIALSLLFIGWALGLGAVASTSDSFGDRLAALYPLSDIVLLTFVILTVRRATQTGQSLTLLLLLGGLAAIAMSDSAFAYLTAANEYGVNGSGLDTGWFAGFLAIALASAVRSKQAVAVQGAAPIDVWQLALPWTVIAAAAVAGLVRVIMGMPLDLFLSLDVAVIGFLIMGSQVQAHVDSYRTLMKARAADDALAEVITCAPAGVARLDAQLRILDANPRFDALFGGHSSAGRKVVDYFSGAAAAEFAARLRSLDGEVETVEGESEVARPDGSRAWVHWSATALPHEHDTAGVYVAMFEDTTGRHEAQDTALANLNLMRRLNAVKTEFLQSVSHEFKTALIGIQGFSEFMRDADQLDINDVRGFAADIHRDAERLDRMVNEMLAIDKVETGRANLSMGLVDVNALVDREAEEARRGLDGVTLVLELDPRVPEASGDREMIAEAVRALLVNASRYSPDGGCITVRTCRRNEFVEIVVSDQGSGERADFDKDLFRTDDLYAENPIRRVVGTGLGLGIVRRVAELHAGRVWVDRRKDGSDFHLTLHVGAAAVGGMVA